MKRSFFLLFFLLPSLILAQHAENRYWEKYAKPLDVENDPTWDSFSMLDSVVDKFDFFFTAEQHWKSINTRIQFAFLTYLHQHAGVRNMIVEGGYSYGFLINQFLETGDERLLKKVVHDIPVCPDNQMEMFRKIRVYNMQFPEKDRIKVTGIDLEHSPELVIQCLNTLRPGGKIPRSIQRKIEHITSLHQSPYFEEKRVKKFFQRLYRDINSKRRNDYQKYWGNDFDLFEMIVENTVQGYSFSFIRASIFTKSWQKREDRMFRNFLSLSKHMKEGKYYAQFGSLHTDIKKSFVWEFPSLAHRLNYFNNSPVENKVLTISRYFRKMQTNYEKLGEYDSFLQMMNEIEDHFSENIILCSMIGRNSPFREMSKTFQFILLINENAEKEGCD